MDIKKENFLIDNYLKKKDLLDYIIKELNKEIVGEEETIKTIFICAMGRLVENCQIASYNLLINSSAGAGKDYLAERTLNLIPKDFYLKRTRISPTVLNYWKNTKSDPSWTWNGKILYLEDIGENVLNSDTFKVMTSSGSHTTILKDQIPIDIEIKGKPVCILTTAHSIPSPELTRRFEFINLNESEEQTANIMERHSFYAINGKKIELDPNIIEIQYLLKRVKVIIPFAEKIHKYFPISNIMLRTKYPRFLDFIKSSCALHQFQRQISEDGCLIAEEQDYNLAKEIIERLSKNKLMIPLTMNQQKIIKFFEDNKELKTNAVNIANQLNNFIALKNLINNLNLLVHYGLLEKSISQDIFHRDLEVYSLSEILKEKEILKLPYFKEL